MARSKIQMPTEETLNSALSSLDTLMTKKAESPVEKIWSTLGQKIIEAREKGHSWEDISSALAAGGITLSAATLRTTAPTQKPKKPRTRKAVSQESSSGKSGGSGEKQADIPQKIEPDKKKETGLPGSSYRVREELKNLI